VGCKIGAVFRRQLAAQFLAALGPAVVAVDRVQPVAAAVSLSGEILDVVSWCDLVQPLEAMDWPNRRVGVDGERIFVQDLPDGEPVVVTLGSERTLRVERTRDLPEVRWLYPRVFGGPWGKRGRWTFASRRDGHPWTPQVSLDGTWSAGHGSIVAHTVVGGAMSGEFEGGAASKDDFAVVAIRRAEARPWAFAPPHDLVVLDGRTGTPIPRPVPSIDISDRCWTPQISDMPRKLAAYLRFTIGDAEVLRERGGRDVRIVVTDLETRPVVDIEFGLEAAPGKRFVRRDEPFDELGRVAGLAFWNVIFDEERFDLLLDATPGPDGRVAV
jgi:hypothetical protein